jgi:hypothetical protein
MAIQIESPETKIGARPGFLRRAQGVSRRLGNLGHRAAVASRSLGSDRSVNLDVIRHGSVPDRLWASERKTH